ncbi:MAG: fused MFS/spermidine synthase [Verrucomicrobia bacterium]|nr:fused MFS/spermidine synthase [Verrucomicrobiota bacterium]
MLPFALTIFTGAFLLFQVQPLIGKYILPWFGGSPGVWTTCLLFFQMLLLGGYAYAHYSTSRLKPRTQAIVHGVLLLLALACIPFVTPSDSWKPAAVDNPTGQILLLLTVSIGLPYFVLSATGPLMQEWFSVLRPGVSPYRLYALSNIGSLLALVTYPFYFEPSFSRKAQAGLWGCGLMAYVVACGYCVWLLFKKSATLEKPASTEAAPEEAPAAATPGQKILWVLLPACASVLLLATTNKICQDVAVIPFLWVLPLAIYLLTFIISFDSPRWYKPGIFGALLALGLTATTYLLFEGTSVVIGKQLLGYCGTLFVGCMICHGELYRLKPHPKFLTSYFLLISAGGAMGGLFVAVVAPLIFNSYLELHVGLWALSALVAVVAFKQNSLPLALGLGIGALLSPMVIPTLHAGWTNFDMTSKSLIEQFKFFGGKYWWIPLIIFALFALSFGDLRRVLLREWRARMVGFLIVLSLGLATGLWIQAWQSKRDAVLMTRNFYGALTVFEYSKDSPTDHYFLLQHGKITHGLQFVDPEMSRRPTSYYTEGSGLALAVKHFPRATNRRIGVVGLGTGTSAALARGGDYMRIYEINAEVRRIAENNFSYLKDSPGKVELAMGDARLSMEHEPPQNFDILALDAFSSDAIPVHLLTKEAFEIYQRHLKPDGVIVVHVSNRYLNLEPVVETLAKEFGYQTAIISFNDEGQDDWWVYSSTWILVTKNKELLKNSAIRNAITEPEDENATAPLWTDDFASLFPILKK